MKNNKSKILSEVISIINKKSPKIIISSDISESELDKMHEIFEKYVPGRGKADTVYGEICRAINRLIYRFYNDGDLFFEDYGIETAGSSALYLMDGHEGFDEILNSMIYKNETIYENGLEEIVDLFLNYESSTIEKLVNTKNDIDSTSDYYEEAMKEWHVEDEEEDYYDNYDDNTDDEDEND
jgi:hypothetical protein